jgi:hypothetical protein
VGALCLWSKRYRRRVPARGARTPRAACVRTRIARSSARGRAAHDTNTNARPAPAPRRAHNHARAATNSFALRTYPRGHSTRMSSFSVLSHAQRPNAPVWGWALCAQNPARGLHLLSRSLRALPSDAVNVPPFPTSVRGAPGATCSMHNIQACLCVTARGSVQRDADGPVGRPVVKRRVIVSPDLCNPRCQRDPRTRADRADGRTAGRSDMGVLGVFGVAYLAYLAYCRQPTPPCCLAEQRQLNARWWGSACTREYR